MKLSRCEEGSVIIVRRIDCGKEEKKILNDHGVFVGRCLTVERNDVNVIVSVDGCLLFICHDVAECIEVTFENSDRR